MITSFQSLGKRRRRSGGGTTAAVTWHFGGLYNTGLGIVNIGLLPRAMYKSLTTPDRRIPNAIDEGAYTLTQVFGTLTTPPGITP